MPSTNIAFCTQTHTHREREREREREKRTKHTHIRWKHNAALMEEQQKIETKRKQHSMINLEDLNQLEVCFAL